MASLRRRKVVSVVVGASLFVATILLGKHAHDLSTRPESAFAVWTQDGKIHYPPDKKMLDSIKEMRAHAPFNKDLMVWEIELENREAKRKQSVLLFGALSVLAGLAGCGAIAVGFFRRKGKSMGHA